MRVVFFLLMMGCVKPEIFILENGTTTTCKNWGSESCGLWLDDCDSGLSYDCQQNVVHTKEENIRKEKKDLCPVPKLSF